MRKSFGLNCALAVNDMMNSPDKAMAFLIEFIIINVAALLLNNNLSFIRLAKQNDASVENVIVIDCALSLVLHYKAVQIFNNATKISICFQNNTTLRINIDGVFIVGKIV